MEESEMDESMNEWIIYLFITLPPHILSTLFHLLLY